MAHPGRLFDLALDTLGKYVYGLCSKMMTPVEKSTKNKSKKRKLGCTHNINEVKVICKNLNEMIKEMPVGLANDLTNKLLDCVDDWEFEVGKCKTGSMEEQIYEEVVLSVIHPAVTRIEPGQYFIKYLDIFLETEFCSSLCASLVTKNAYTLQKLTNLHVLHSNMKFYFVQVQFPSQLTEFSGICNDVMVLNIVKSCPYLRYLNVYGSKSVTDASVHFILRLKHLQKLNISHTGITNKGINKFIDGLFEKFGNLPTLKYFAFSSDTYQVFKCLQKFPDLKVCFQLDSNINYEINLDVSPLYNFKNIRELEITTTLKKVNKALREIGSQLVYLNVEIINKFLNNDEDYDDEENWDNGENLKVGQYCKSLKSFHISINQYFFPHIIDFIREPLPGFKTIRRLALHVDDCIFEEYGFFYYLISQCVNMKEITVEFDRGGFNVYQFMSKVILFECMKRVEVIYFAVRCAKCCIVEVEDENYFDQSIVNEIVHLLVIHCPNLRVIALDPIFHRNYDVNSQKLKFVPIECNCE